MPSEVFMKFDRLVEKNRNLALDASKYLYTVPETGFKEYKTSAYLEEQFEKLGYTLKKAQNIPGFYTDIDTGKPGPKVLIFGELDAVICAEHEFADKETGAVHACGHYCQGSALLGIAAALKEKGALDGLSGSVRLCAVPAEELLETSYREELRQKGIIKYMGGKVEFIYRGYFDDCDLAFMVHTSQSGTDVPQHNNVIIERTSNGCISKNIVFKGKAAHAGGAPENGINALYIATQSLSAQNAIRETIVDNEYGRVHSIITKGGQMVNAIPSEVRVETQVRGATNKIIGKINDKINRAYAACAASMGGNVEIHDRPGYSPIISDETMLEIVERVASDCANEVIFNKYHGGSCSDIGDVESVMPAIQFFVSGAIGAAHGKSFYVPDVESAVLFSAKVQLAFLYELLNDDAKEAKRVIANAKLPYASKEEYLADIDRFLKDKKAVRYNDDGTVTLDF